MQNDPSEQHPQAQGSGVQAASPPVSLHEVLESLRSISNRLERLESGIGTLEALAKTLPAGIATMTDMVDAHARDQEAAGSSVMDRVEHLKQLADVATLPDNLRRMERLIGRLEKLEEGLHLLDQLPGMVSTVVDSVDARAGDAIRAGHDLPNRMNEGLRLLGKLSEERSVRLLERLLDQAPQLEQAMEVLEHLPGLVATVTDIIDDRVNAVNRKGLDVHDLLKAGFEAMTEAVHVFRSDEMRALINSGVLAPQSVDIVGRAGQAMAEVRAQPSGEAGFGALFGALGDSNIRRSLDFGLRFARRFGELLGPAHKGYLPK